MNKELNIRGFMNEMSYDLSMQELEALVVDYQNVILDYFVTNQYNFKVKREFKEVCELIRSDKFFKTISALIQTGDSRIDFDMAYVLYTATHFSFVEKELKDEAVELGYKLRNEQLEGQLTDDDELNIAIVISSIKTFRNYNSTPFIRSKMVENIVESLPEILFNVCGKLKGLEPKQITDKMISEILFKSIIDLEVRDILMALGKAKFPNDIDPKYKPFAIRIQSFLYKIISTLSQQSFDEAMVVICKSIKRFNERTGMNETFMDKYLNYRLLVGFVKSGHKIPAPMFTSCAMLAEFINKHKEFAQLF